jgi:hypothetical protein
MIKLREEAGLERSDIAYSEPPPLPYDIFSSTKSLN